MIHQISSLPVLSYPSKTASISLFTADTVVLTHAAPSISTMPLSELPGFNQELLEKPESKEDNLRMLCDLNGGICEVVTGVALGESCESRILSFHCAWISFCVVVML